MTVASIRYEIVVLLPNECNIPGSSPFSSDITWRVSGRLPEISPGIWRYVYIGDVTHRAIV